MRVKIEEFRPADFDRIVKTASRTPGVHPDLTDLANMAKDTLDGAGLGFTPSPEQAAAARQTIVDLKETPPCPSTEK